MKAYLERAQQHEEFMKTQRDEFKIGKRHLANIMGEDPVIYENQEKIDVSYCQVLKKISKTFPLAFHFYRKQ